ncbi:hypothetical protein N7536_002664 [Penicillium majusculum]|nr:hypothetical protein N7536_002664 [Penicillium majusculum]
MAYGRPSHHMVLQSAIRGRHHPRKKPALSAQAQSHYTRDDSGYWITRHENRFDSVIDEEANRAKKKKIDPPLVHVMSYSKCRVTTASLYSHLTFFLIHFHLTLLSFKPFSNPFH